MKIRGEGAGESTKWAGLCGGRASLPRPPGYVCLSGCFCWNVEIRWTGLLMIIMFVTYPNVFLPFRKALPWVSCALVTHQMQNSTFLPKTFISEILGKWAKLDETDWGKGEKWKGRCLETSEKSCKKHVSRVSAASPQAILCYGHSVEIAQCTLLWTRFDDLKI